MEQFDFLSDLVGSDLDDVRRILDEENERGKAAVEFLCPPRPRSIASDLQNDRIQPRIHRPSECQNTVQSNDIIPSSNLIQALPAATSSVPAPPGCYGVQLPITHIAASTPPYSVQIHMPFGMLQWTPPFGTAVTVPPGMVITSTHCNTLQGNAVMTDGHLVTGQMCHQNGPSPRAELVSAPASFSPTEKTPIVSPDERSADGPGNEMEHGATIAAGAEVPATYDSVIDEISLEDTSTTALRVAQSNGGEHSVSCPASSNSSGMPKTQQDKQDVVDVQNEARLQSPKMEPKSWASILQGERTAKAAIVKHIIDDSSQASWTEEEDLKRALAESKREYAERNRHALGGGVKVSDGARVVAMDVPASSDPAAKHLAVTLKNYHLAYNGPSFVLRGLVNRGNWCYVNATLQALIACPTFFHLLRHVASKVRERVHSSTPFLDTLAKFVMEFPLVRDNPTAKPRRLSPLDPVYLYQIVSQLKADSSFKGRQEDAEEFLLLALDRLHEELVSVLSLLDKDKGKQHLQQSEKGNEAADTVDDDEWRQVYPGGKAAITRQVDRGHSPIRDIYSGQLRYGLSHSGKKESYNLEPFFTLPLDVQADGVTDVISALRALTTTETFKLSQGKDKAEVTAKRRVELHVLPRVLIFHLKYFVYTGEGLKKIVKPISYEMDLKLQQAKYKLFAVVFHHGDKAEGGHYTADVFHGGRWFSMDDTKMVQVDDHHVSQFQPPRVPYLLFYRRMIQFM